MSTATAIQQSQVSNQIALAVARKTLDVQKQQGKAAVELINQASLLQAQLSNNRIDIRV